LRFPLETLDELKVRVIVENSSLLLSRVPVQGRAGLSLLVTARHKSTIWNTLLDVGPDPGTLIGNLTAMGVHASSINTIVLSHKHLDHSQGLTQVVRETGKKNLPIVAHPCLADPTFVTRPYLSQLGLQPGDSIEEVKAAGGVFILSKEPVEVMPGLYTSGEVPRVTGFEIVELPLRTNTCDGQVVPDQVPDDQCLIANVAGKGLVIITGCSHSGIINICKHAREITGINVIHAVIGGFHLVDGGPERVAQTIREFKAISPALLASGHCTGFDAEVEFALAFHDTYKHMTVGAQFTF